MSYPLPAAGAAELGHDPLNGWLYRGRLVPLINISGLNDPGFEAW